MQYPPVKQAVVSSAAKKEEQARLWFSQIRAVLDEKEKQWAVKLKEEEAAKLGQNNMQLERLTWFRNEVDGQHCDSSEMLYDKDMYYFLNYKEVEETRIANVLQKASSRQIEPGTESEYDYGVDTQPVIDALDLHLTFQPGTGKFEVYQPVRKSLEELHKQSEVTLPGFGGMRDGLGSLGEGMLSATNDLKESAQSADGEESGFGFGGFGFGGGKEEEESKDYTNGAVVDEGPVDMKYHPGVFGTQSSMMPGWSCCFQQYEGAPGCQTKTLPSNEEVKKMEKEIQNKQDGKEEDNGILSFF